MKKENRFLIQSTVQKLVMLLVRDYKMSIIDAFSTVYNSELYERLNDLDTGLYYQSPLYVYHYLQNELKTGRLA
ncbi:MAG: hypothetical protein LUI85_21970 [Bacteroides sp.]|jgi:hypothetical protein|nr:hypothetical protein [Bacteroides sp.]